jgi:hypothetical protein
MNASGVDLRAVVRHYISHHRARARAELDSFEAEPTLEAAARRAGRTVLADGRRDPHHTRRPQELLDRAAVRLVERLTSLDAATNFARLLEAVRAAVGHFDGLGELYLYDTALRIGAKKGTLPTRVYLHAGTRAGAQRLGLDIDGRKALDRSDLPLALQELEFYEVEDVLCIYNEIFDELDADVEDAGGCWPEERRDRTE